MKVEDFAKQDVLQNLFLLPFIVCFVQFCYLFVGLFRTGYGFESVVLITSLFCVVFWAVCCILDYKRHRNVFVSRKNSVIVLLFIISAFYIVHLVWFTSYHGQGTWRNIDAIGSFFVKGDVNMDIIFQSALAESIITNGVASLGMNAVLPVSYHLLSHYLLALLSLLLKVPAYITYNYLFPVLFVPPLLLLIPKTVAMIRCHLTGDGKLSMLDYFFIVPITFGFFTLSFQDKIFLPNATCISVSESYITSVLLILSCICLVLRYEKSPHWRMLCFCLMPFWIILISFCKISSGFIFSGSCFLFLLRFDLASKKKRFFFLLPIITFLLYFFVYYGGVLLRESFHNKLIFAEGLRINLSKIPTFKFRYVIKAYTGKYEFWHYLVYLSPNFLLLLFVDFDEYKRDGLKTLKNIFIEVAMLMTCGILLLDLFYTKASANTQFFTILISFLSWILLQGYDFANKILVRTKISCFSIAVGKKIKQVEVLAVIPFLIYIPILLLAEGKIRDSVARAIISRYGDDMPRFKKEFPSSLSELFSPAENASNDMYCMFNEIRDAIKDNRNQFCVFVNDNFSMISLFDRFPGRRMRPYLAISAYLGCPVINSCYIDSEGSVFRGDGLQLGDERSGYGMVPRLIGEKIAMNNILQHVSLLGYRYVIILVGKSYRIMDTRNIQMQ